MLLYYRFLAILLFSFLSIWGEFFLRVSLVLMKGLVKTPLSQLYPSLMALFIVMLTCKTWVVPTCCYTLSNSMLHYVWNIKICDNFFQNASHTRNLLRTSEYHRCYERITNQACQFFSNRTIKELLFYHMHQSFQPSYKNSFTRLPLPLPS